MIHGRGIARVVRVNEDKPDCNRVTIAIRYDGMGRRQAINVRRVSLKLPLDTWFSFRYISRESNEECGTLYRPFGVMILKEGFDPKEVLNRIPNAFPAES